MLARLGKHTTGKGCLYIRSWRTSTGVLERIVAVLDEIDRRYPG